MEKPIYNDQHGIDCVLLGLILNITLYLKHKKWVEADTYLKYTKIKIQNWWLTGEIENSGYISYY